jgi:inhibitor of cysteine peptidase
MHAAGAQFICRRHMVTHVPRFACALAAIGMSACVGAHRGNHSGGENSLPNVTLTQEDKGRSIALKVGQTIAVHLRENPTTGFRWTLEQGGDSILEPLDSTYVQAAISATGGGGLHVWTFEARQQGNARLVFKLGRAWQGTASDSDRFEVTIVSRQ